MSRFIKLPKINGQASNHQIQRGQADAWQAAADRKRVAKVRAARNTKTERAANSDKN